MSGATIKRRLFSSLFFIIMILLMFSCIQDISQPEGENIQILKTTIELDRFENELFIQVETNQQESEELIQNIFVELTYIGDDIYEYSDIFQLYDNGTNGDLIPFNGIYTILTTADTVVLPEIESEIIEINMPNNFQLHQTESDSMDISVLIYGKAFRVTSEIVNSFNQITKDSQIVNLNNNSIMLQVNTEFMYAGDINNNGECVWTQSDSPNPNLFAYTYPDDNFFSRSLSNNSNKFEFYTKMPFNPIIDCGGTGRAIFRFIITDHDTMIPDSTNLNLTIYGCGDGVCESGLEDTSSCPGDCQ